MRRRWRLAALLLVGATLANCAQGANEGQHEAPENQQQHEPVPQTTQLPQHGKD